MLAARGDWRFICVSSRDLQTEVVGIEDYKSPRRMSSACGERILRSLADTVEFLHCWVDILLC